MPKPTDFLPFSDAMDEFLFGPEKTWQERGKKAVGGITREQIGNELIGVILPGYTPTTKAGKAFLKKIRRGGAVGQMEMADAADEVFPRALRKSDGTILSHPDVTDHVNLRDKLGISRSDSWGYEDGYHAVDENRFLPRDDEETHAILRDIEETSNALWDEVFKKRGK